MISLAMSFVVMKNIPAVVTENNGASFVTEPNIIERIVSKASNSDRIARLKNAIVEFEKNKRENFVLFFEKYELYKNSLVLYNDLYKYLNKILYVTPLLEELYSLDIVTAIRNLRDNEIFEYKNSDLKIIIRYYLNKKSLVQLFFKEKLISSSV